MYSNQKYSKTLNVLPSCESVLKEALTASRKPVYVSLKVSVFCISVSFNLFPCSCYFNVKDIEICKKWKDKSIFISPMYI